MDNSPIQESSVQMLFSVSDLEQREEMSDSSVSLQIYEEIFDESNLFNPRADESSHSESSFSDPPSSPIYFQSVSNFLLNSNIPSVPNSSNRTTRNLTNSRTHLTSHPATPVIVQRVQNRSTVPRFQVPSLSFSPNIFRVSEYSMAFLNRSSMAKRYGHSFIICVKKMVRKGLFFVSRVGNIYKKFMDAYMIYNEKSTKVLVTKFMSCLPKLKTINDIILKNKLNDYDYYRDVLFFKIALDLYDDFATNKEPNSFDLVKPKICLNKIAKKFYEMMAPAILEHIKAEIASLSLSFYQNKEHKKLLEYSQDEFVIRYNEFLNEQRNLFGAIELTNNSFVQ